MSYLVPYNNSLGLGVNVLHRGFQYNGESSSAGEPIPDDTYVWVEWYCANPLCNCNEAHIEIRGEQQGNVVAMTRVPFQYPLLPMAVVEELHTPYAAELVKLLDETLQKDPSLLIELRQHYQFIRSVAQDSRQPGHAAVKHWSEHGLLPKAGRKRHRKA